MIRPPGLKASRGHPSVPQASDPIQNLGWADFDPFDQVSVFCVAFRNPTLLQWGFAIDGWCAGGTAIPFADSSVAKR